MDSLYGLAMLGVNVVAVIIVFFILDRGRIISPAYGRATPQQIARLRAVTAARALISARSQETDGDQREGAGPPGVER